MLKRTLWKQDFSWSRRFYQPEHVCNIFNLVLQVIWDFMIAKQTVADPKQICLLQRTATCHFCDKVCGSTMASRSYIRRHGLNFNAKDSFFIRYKWVWAYKSEFDRKSYKRFHEYFFSGIEMAFLCKEVTAIMFVCMYVCVSVCVCVCTLVHVCVFVWVCMCVYIFTLPSVTARMWHRLIF